MRYGYYINFFGIAAFCLLLLLAWGLFIEPYRIRVRKVVIHDDVLHNAWGDVRIAQLSDIHITTMGKREQTVIDTLARLKPDIIVITGDIAQWNSDPEDAVRFIEGLKAPDGVYCVMGDADFSSRRRHCLFCHPHGDVHKHRIHPAILRDEIRCVNLDGERKLYIAGVAPKGDWAGDHDYPAAIVEEPGPPLLVISHFSGRWNEIEPRRAVLWLSGDTHGGQILMPSWFWRHVHKKPDPEHMSGLFYRGGHCWLYVNQGIGTTENVPVRIGVPPEITLFTFEPAGSRGNGRR